MKKKILLIFIILHLLILMNFSVNSISINNSDESQWEISDIVFTNDGCRYVDSAIGSDDAIYISYFNVNSEALNVVLIHDDEVNIEEVDSSGIVGKYCSIAVDKDNNVHLSYFDSTNKNLKYAYWDKSNWQIDVVDDSKNVGQYSCIGLDSSNNPHISYYDEENKNLKYCYNNGHTWFIEVVDDKADTGIATSLVVDTNKNVHISYADGQNFLYYARKTNSEWQISLVDDKCSVFGSTSIDLDSENNAHISYFDVGTSEENWNLKHAFIYESEWILEIVDPDLKYFWNDWGVSISIDEFDRVHIAYYYWYKWDLRYAIKVNDKWSSETVDGDGDTGVYASIVLNSENYPMITYLSRSSFVLRLAKKTQFNPDPPSPPIGPNSGKINEIYSFEATGYDFDEDKIRYGWDWGNGEEIEWTGYVESGEKVEIQHSWSEKQKYNIRVKITDERGYESLWSEPKEITFTKQKQVIFSNFAFFGNIIRFLQIL